MNLVPFPIDKSRGDLYFLKMGWGRVGDRDGERG